jgi:hypothetical protein
VNPDEQRSRLDFQENSRTRGGDSNGGGNGLGYIGIARSQLGIRLGGGPLDQAQGLDEAAAESLPADREVLNGPLRLGPVECALGNLNLTHRVLLDPESA